MNVNVSRIVPESIAIRRILVALDASTYSLVVLEAAATLAHLLKAELIGVFVEDINLVRLAQLPFAHEVRHLAARLQKLDTVTMAQQLRTQATWARQKLAETAESKELSWSFRVLQGPVTAELLGAALEADLLVLGRGRRGQTTRLGSTARTAVTTAPHCVLLVSLGVDLERPMLFIYDGSAAAGRALAIAAALAPLRGHLRVLIWATDDASAQEYRTAIAEQLHESALNLSFRRLHQDESAAVVDIARRSGAGLLILAGEAPRLPQGVFQALLETCELPMLVVR